MSIGSFRERYGPWAVVAGASEGLGAAFATALARRGLNLVLLARRAEALEGLARELTAAHSVSVRTVPCDLGHPSWAETLQQSTADLEVGLAVYNAASSFRGPHLAQPIEAVLALVDVNVRGPLLLVHSLAPPMVERRRGGIVLMSSLVGLQGSPWLGAYAASKAFNTVFGQSLWSELRPHGVDVLVSCAGAIRTPGYLKLARKDAPGTLDPEAVAEHTLDALGGGPLTVPGALNRLAAFVVGRLLPRRAALALLGRSTQDALGSST